MAYVDKSFLGKRYYRPKKSTCCICNRPSIHIEKIHIKGPKYIYHCDSCEREARNLAEILKEDYGVV